jgi:uncharacterized protein YjbJ (UPF0337 family)
MNKDQIEGTVKNAAGKMQQKVGEAVDSKEHQVKGLKKQIEGQAQKNVGNVKEDIKKASKAR